nr:hypothetical protein CFP56_59189 [Quercus suber]
MLAKPSVLVNLVFLTKRPTLLGAPIHTISSLLSGLAVLTKRICCLGDLVHSKVLKELADTAWVPKLSDLLQSQLNLNFSCRKLMSIADAHSLVLFCSSIRWADIL